MFALILAFYYFGGELVADRGPITADAQDTVTLPALASGNSLSVQLPLGTEQAQRPRDPSDRAPLAVSFASLLGVGVEIEEILAVTMSAAGVAAGVAIDQAAPRLPIIDEAGGQAVQIWLAVAEGSRSNPAFQGEGLRVGIAFWVRTNEAAFREYERTAAVVFRQL